VSSAAAIGRSPDPRTRYNSKLADRTHPKCCGRPRDKGCTQASVLTIESSYADTQTPAFLDSMDCGQHACLRMSGSVRRRFSAMLMLPALLFAGWAHGGELFRCRYDEIVRRTCCCPQSTAPETTDCSIRGPASDCCDVSTIGVDASPTSSERVTPVVSSSVVWRLPGQELAILDLRPFGAASRRDVQDTSPPILRLTCSLQI